MGYYGRWWWRILGDALSGEAFQHFHKVAAIENTGLTVLRYHPGFEEDPCWRLWFITIMRIWLPSRQRS